MVVSHKALCTYHSATSTPLPAPLPAPARIARARPHLRAGDVGAMRAELEVELDGAGEEDRLLAHDGHAGVQRPQVEGPHVHPVQQHPPALRAAPPVGPTSTCAAAQTGPGFQFRTSDAGGRRGGGGWGVLDPCRFISGTRKLRTRETAGTPLFGALASAFTATNAPTPTAHSDWQSAVHARLLLGREGRRGWAWGS